MMRTDRQELIKNWDQSKVYDSSIAIISDDLALDYLSAGAAALGFGVINIYDLSRNDHLWFTPKHYEVSDSSRPVGNEQVTSHEGHESVFQQELKRIAPEIEISVNKEEPSLEELIKNDVLILALQDVNVLNNFLSKEQLLSKEPIVLVTNNYAGVLAVINNKEVLYDYLKKALKFDKQLQGPVPVGVLSALALEEARKKVLKLGDWDVSLDRVLTYNWNSPSRVLLTGKALSLTDKLKVSRAKIGIIGAGGTGTYSSIAAYLSGVREIHIYDFDVIEVSNLNRQVLYGDSIGKNKALVAAEKLSRIKVKGKQPVVKGFSKGLGDFFGEGVSLEEFKNQKYDAVLGCVDNLETIKLLDEYALNNGCVFVNGNCSPFTGVVSVFYGLQNQFSKPVSLQIHLEDMIQERARKNQQLLRTSCNLARKSPSIVTSNMLVGSAMIGELLNALIGKNHISSPFSYNAYTKSKIGVEKYKNLYNQPLKNVKPVVDEHLTSELVVQT